VDQFGWVGFAFFVATMGAAVLVIWRVESRNQGAQDIQKIASAADEDLVAELLRKINDSGFRPDLIVGIARGGLIVAGYLSKQITKISTIPVISLWRQKGTNEFKNRFNRIELQREDFGRALSGPLKILIVDGFASTDTPLMLPRNLSWPLLAGKRWSSKLPLFMSDQVLES
jgi:hypothetical protein